MLAGRPAWVACYSNAFKVMVTKYSNIGYLASITQKNYLKFGQLARTIFRKNLVTLVLHVGRNQGENKRFPPSRIKFGRSSRSRPLPRNKLIKLFPNHSKKKVDANWKNLGWPDCSERTDQKRRLCYRSYR